jgi:prolyl-tRNA editing enzyme YbaK/EbsC (Cys-tRNA(Pro) deacylase)
MDIKIKKLLEANKIKYKPLEHRKVYTAFNSAETQHVDSKQIVKVVLTKLSKPSLHMLKDGKPASLDFVFVAVPAGKRVDLKKVAKAINDHQSKSYKLLIKSQPKIKKPSQIKAKLASEKDIEKKMKTKVGLLHPFSQLFGYPILLDKKLAKNKKLIVSAGSYTESLEIATKDFLKLMEGQLGSFTE